MAGNRFAEGKATKLSSTWAGSHEEVLKIPFLRTVVVILGRLCKRGVRPRSGGYRADRGMYFVWELRS